MGFEPMVNTRWHTSWITNTVTRRETMLGVWCRVRAFGVFAGRCLLFLFLKSVESRPSRPNSTCRVRTSPQAKKWWLRWLV